MSPCTILTRYGRQELISEYVEVKKLAKAIETQQEC